MNSAPPSPSGVSTTVPQQVPLVSSAARACAVALHNGWPEIESVLLSVARFPSFAGFLADYRGLPPAAPPAEQVEAQTAVGTALLEAFRAAFLQAKERLNENEEVSAEGNLVSFDCLFEQAANLALFLWFGLDDRNFQYRTVVHFCALEGLGDEIAPGVCLSFSESGVRVGPEGSEHFPARWPLSAALVDDSLLGNDTSVLARLRSVQRETCLLIDDWEHENALLAVEHTRVRQALSGASPARVEAALGDILRRMGLLRDALSVWAIRSLAQLQAFVARIEAAHVNADVLAECDATQALLLSGLQKIHLPASVSRYRYGAATFQELSLWCQGRLRFKPEDVSTRLLLVSLEVGSGNTGSQALWADLQRVFGARTHEWSLDYDPSSGLKACCWRLPREVHLLLCAFVTVLVFRKFTPAKPGAEWLSLLASLVQMPETYPPSPLLPQLRGDLRPPEGFKEAVVRESLSLLSSLAAGGAKSGVESDCISYLSLAFSELVGSVSTDSSLSDKEPSQ